MYYDCTCISFSSFMTLFYKCFFSFCWISVETEAKFLWCATNVCCLLIEDVVTFEGIGFFAKFAISLIWLMAVDVF